MYWNLLVRANLQESIGSEVSSEKTVEAEEVIKEGELAIQG